MTYSSSPGAEKIKKSLEILSESKEVLKSYKDEACQRGNIGAILKELQMNNLNNKINIAQYWITTQSMK